MADRSTVIHFLPDDDPVDEAFSKAWVFSFAAAMVLKYGRREFWRGLGLGVGIGATLIAVIVTASLARAETIDGDRIMIVDGDTIALPCDPVRGIYPGCAERVRLEGIDAPETHRARCDAERGAGLAAKEALATLLRGRQVEITRTGRDRYGRTLARLTSGGQSVDEAMLAAGVAIPYRAGRAAWADRCRHWCPEAPRCEE